MKREAKDDPGRSLGSVPLWWDAWPRTLNLADPARLSLLCHGPRALPLAERHGIPCVFDSRHSEDGIPLPRDLSRRSTKRSRVPAAPVWEGGSHRPLARRSQSHPAVPHTFPHRAAAHDRPPATLLICRPHTGPTKPVNRSLPGARAFGASSPRAAAATHSAVAGLTDCATREGSFSPHNSRASRPDCSSGRRPSPGGPERENTPLSQQALR